MLAGTLSVRKGKSQCGCQKGKTVRNDTQDGGRDQILQGYADLGGDRGPKLKSHRRILNKDVTRYNFHF